MATVRTRIGPADHGREMSLEEFREAEEQEGYRCELARGVVEVTQVPNDPHGQVVSNLQWFFYRYKTAYPDVIRRVGGGGEFQLWIPGMVSGRNPDLAVVLHRASKDERGRRLPSLVAEVVSERGEDRDYHEKREEYLACGIGEYWIVDPMLLRVTVLIRGERDGQARWDEASFSGDETIVSELLPALDCRVSDLWVDAELDAPDGE